jgi:peptidoglycan/xylan/chitin deacetylase (PgdA/CDA1 family)
MAENSVWKKAARVALHDLGGLSLLRWKNRRKFGVLMFHSFSPSNTANLDVVCGYIARTFEPMDLHKIVIAIRIGSRLPDNVIAVTIDDGYRSFLEHGFPVLQKHRLPTTLYAVSRFADGRIWLWFDQVEFAIRQTTKTFLRFTLNGTVMEMHLGSDQEKTSACNSLIERLKEVPNDCCLRFVATIGTLCGVDVPGKPPDYCAPMNWDDLRAIAADGVEVGCHTGSHPILSRVTDPLELRREILESKRLIEENLARPVRHFCYPNGRDVDIGEPAKRLVAEAGYDSATTTTWGLNSGVQSALSLHRLPFDDALDFRYAIELLAGLHLQRGWF